MKLAFYSMSIVGLAAIVFFCLSESGSTTTPAGGSGSATKAVAPGQAAKYQKATFAGG